MNILVEQDPETKKYILRFNASLYKESNCFRFVWYKLFRGLTPSNQQGSYFAGYGNAVHRALKLHYSKKPFQECVEAALNYFSKFAVPKSAWQNHAHLVNCITQYVDFYKKEGDLLIPKTINGELLLEKTFAIRFFKTDLVEVLLCGTMDMIAEFASLNVIADTKTRSLKKVNDYKIAEYLNSYNLSSQMMFYKFAYRLMYPGQDADNLINGVFLDEENRNKFKRSDIISYSDRQMLKFEEGLRGKITHLVNEFEHYLGSEDKEKSLEHIFQQNFTCCSQFCDFLPICSTQEESSVETVIETLYQAKLYDPLVFQN